MAATINPNVADCPGYALSSGSHKDNHVRLKITGISQNISTNETTIAYNITVEGTPYVYLKALYVKLGGYVLYENYSGVLSKWSSGQVISSGSKVFKNNDDGSLVINAYIKQMFGYDYSASRWANAKYYQECNVQMVCSNIPRLSEPTLSSNELYVGQSITIYTNRKSPIMKHKIYYSMANNEEVYLASGVDDNYQWNVSKSLANKISLNEDIVSIRVVTVCEGNDIGDRIVQFKLKIPDTEEFSPVINGIDLKESGNVPAGITNYIQNISKIHGNILASGVYGSTIKSYSISINNESFNTKEFTTSIINAVNPKLKVTVTDTRGRTKTYEDTIKVLAYKTPTLNIAEIFRDTKDNNKLYVNLECLVYNLENENSFNVKLYIKEHKEEEYSCIEILDLERTLENDILKLKKSYFALENLDPNVSYDAYLEVNDKLKKVPSTSKFVNTIFKLFNFTGDKKYYANGKLHEKPAFNEHALNEIFYGMLLRSIGNYEGEVLSSDKIEDGKISFNQDNKTLNFKIEGVDYSISLWNSDIRLKEQIKNVTTNYIEKLKAIEHIQFCYKDNKEKVIPIGYSANQLKEIDENFVIANGDKKILQPNISILLPVITKTMQELIIKVEELERKLEKYESN